MKSLIFTDPDELERFQKWEKAVDESIPPMAHACAASSSLVALYRGLPTPGKPVYLTGDDDNQEETWGVLWESIALLDKQRQTS